MHDIALSWQEGAALTAVLGAVAMVSTVAGRTGTDRTLDRTARAIAPFAREMTIIAGLYATWQLAGTLSVLGTQGAFARAEWIERTERTLHLPAEAAVQRVVTAEPHVAQAANLYYATMHFSALFVFLCWLFVRHRDSYRPVRRVLALTTFACLLIQLVPVAPPRLLPGYVDTAEKYHQSVYGLGFSADQLSAMPSVHVAWAVLIGVIVWRVAAGRGRWVGLVHAVLTVVVVVATANHFWADGIVAVAVLAACFAIERAVTAGFSALLPAPAEPVVASAA